MTPCSGAVGLQTLLGELPLAEFRRRHWPSRRLLVRCDPERLGALRSPQLKAIFGDLRRVAALSSWQEVEVFANDAGGWAETVAPERAEALFRSARASVRLRMLQGAEPNVRAWLDAILADLSDTPVRAAYVNAYLSRAGTRGNPHFDGHEVFVVQLWGEKRWRVAPCDSVRAPNRGFELGSDDHVLEELGSDPGLVPREMPPDCEDLTLTPGDVLFLPRGYLHHPIALSDSFHLTFALEAFTLGDLLLDSLRRSLDRDPEWRAVATDALAGSARGNQTRALLASRLGQLSSADDSPLPRMHQLLEGAVRAARRPHGAWFVPNPDAPITVAEPTAAEPVLMLHHDRGTDRVRFRGQHRTLLTWLTQQRAPFPLQQAVANSGELEATDVHRLLRSLVSTGALLAA